MAVTHRPPSPPSPGGVGRTGLTSLPGAVWGWEARAPRPILLLPFPWLPRAPRAPGTWVRAKGCVCRAEDRGLKPWPPALLRYLCRCCASHSSAS